MSAANLSDFEDKLAYLFLEQRFCLPEYIENTRDDKKK